MTKFEAPSFSVFPGSEKNYRDNYDRIFGKKEDKPDPWADEREPEPKKMSDLPPAREAQPAPANPMPKLKKGKKKKAKNEKSKTKKNKKQK